MINNIYYQDLGLVNTSDMFRQAMDEGFAVPAYNFNNMEQLQGIITGCVASKSPVILQVSGSARQYAHAAMLPHLAAGAVAMAEALGHPIPIALHLDHGSSFDLCRACIESGFSSVMIDGSHLSFQENMALTREVVDFAHDFDVTVEAELGVLAGIEDEVVAEKSHFTQPEEVEEFVGKPGWTVWPFPSALPMAPISSKLNPARNHPRCGLTSWKKLKNACRASRSCCMVPLPSCRNTLP
jgi:fructose-bisphosphate aldolase class II